MGDGGKAREREREREREGEKRDVVACTLIVHKYDNRIVVFIFCGIDDNGRKIYIKKNHSASFYIGYK